MDGSTGYLYYWNPVTNLTQYQRPVSEEQLPPPPPLPKLAPLSSVQVHQKHDGDGRYRSHQHQAARVSNERSGHGSADAAHGSSGTHTHVHGTTHSRNSTRSHVSSDARVSLSAEAYRRQHEITVSGDDVPAPYMTFESTGFLPEMLKEVQHAGFSSPTPIQAQSWPITLQSRDVVAIAKTGSGKTIGYLFPGFVHIKRHRNNSKLGPTVLVLSPTRELATQIQDEAEKFGRSSKISCTCLYGGAPKGPQLRDLDRGVDIVVATPGRLNDILEMRRVSLRQVSYLVLDEADRMLDMGFEPQIRKIVKEIPNHRQTLMFTATWPKEVRKIAADLLVNPIQVNIGNIDELVANKAITQYIEMIKPLDKQRRLEQILRSQDAGSKVLIFCSTKRMCDQLARTLARQFVAAAIHGDKSQGDRDRVLNQFKTGRSPILVATDVAARGLDIKDIRVVINYDFPTGVEDYVHRIGRTGRAGATGVSYTFFSEHDSKYARDLVKVLEGADQRVPPELRDMAARGGFGGKSRRWGSGISIRDRGGRIMGRGDSTIGGRSGNDISSSNRVENGNDRNNYGRDRDTRSRNSRPDARSLDKHVHNDAKGISRGSERSRSRSYSSPSPRRERGVLGSGRSRSRSLDSTHSRSRSRSHSIGGRTDGRSAVAGLSGKLPPSQRKETSVDHHHYIGQSPPPRKRIQTSNDRAGQSPPRKKIRTSNDRVGQSPPRRRNEPPNDRGRQSPPRRRRETSNDLGRQTPPRKRIETSNDRGGQSPKREISPDRYRGTSPPRKEISPKRERSSDRYRGPSPPKRERSADRYRRPSPPKREKSADRYRGPSPPKREKSADRYRGPSPPKRERSSDRYRGPSPVKRERSSDRYRGSSPPKRELSSDRYRGPSPPKKEIASDQYRGTSSPKRDISSDRYGGPSSPKTEMPSDRHRSPSPRSEKDNSIDRFRRLSPPSNLQNSADHGRISPVSKNESPIEQDRVVNAHGPVSRDGSLSPLRQRPRSQTPPARQQMENGSSGRVSSAISEQSHNLRETELLDGAAESTAAGPENGEEEEEGLIPADEEEGMILPEATDHATDSREN